MSEGSALCGISLEGKGVDMWLRSTKNPWPGYSQDSNNNNYNSLIKRSL